MATVTLERRAGVRRADYLPIQLRLSTSGRIVESLTKNVSTGGVQCLLDQALVVGETTTLQLPLWRGVAPLRAEAQVVWVRPLAETHQTVVGLRFNTLSGNDRSALVAYVEQSPAVSS